MTKKTGRTWGIDGLVFFSVAIVLWLIPFFKAGWKGWAYPKLPRAVKFQYNAAGLFTRRSTRWWDHHLEIQRADDSRVELNERDVFPMGAFGFRTRYDRILNETDRSRLAGRIRHRLADHVAGKLRDREPAVKAIRLIRSVWDVGAPEMAHPPGPWSPPPVEAIALRNRHRLGTYQLRGGRAIEVTAAAGSPGNETERTRAGTVQRRVTVTKSEAGSVPPKQEAPSDSSEETARESR